MTHDVTVVLAGSSCSCGWHYPDASYKGADAAAQAVEHMRKMRDFENRKKPSIAPPFVAPK